MQFLQFLSESIIPITIFMILSYALLNRQNVYQDFLKGAKDGFLTVIDILPTLIGLMTAVGILRASGFLDFFSKSCWVLCTFRQNCSLLLSSKCFPHLLQPVCS